MQAIWSFLYDLRIREPKFSNKRQSSPSQKNLASFSQVIECYKPQEVIFKGRQGVLKITVKVVRSFYLGPKTSRINLFKKNAIVPWNKNFEQFLLKLSSMRDIGQGVMTITVEVFYQNTHYGRQRVIFFDRLLHKVFWQSWWKLGDHLINTQKFTENAIFWNCYSFNGKLFCPFFLKFLNLSNLREQLIWVPKDF